MASFTEKHGRDALFDALARGQYRHPDGLMFGGADREWSNRTLFHGAYARTHSYFNNADFAARGLPGPDVRHVLRRVRRVVDQLPRHRLRPGPALAGRLGFWALAGAARSR